MRFFLKKAERLCRIRASQPSSGGAGKTFPFSFNRSGRDCDRSNCSAPGNIRPMMVSAASACGPAETFQLTTYNCAARTGPAA
jgi:hypothetical protein